MERKTLKASSREILEQQITKCVEDFFFPFGEVAEANGWHSIEIVKAPDILIDMCKQLNLSGEFMHKQVRLLSQQIKPNATK